MIDLPPTYDVDVYHEALSNFEYVSDMSHYSVSDKWKRTYHIDKHFRGDCEDLAFSLQYVIGGEVWYIILPEGAGTTRAHAALVKDGFVYDNLHTEPVRLGNYNGVFIGTLDYTHHSITVGEYTELLK